jgi:hypothetical protein
MTHLISFALGSFLTVFWVWVIYMFRQSKRRAEHERAIFDAKQAQPTLEEFVYPENLEIPTFLRETPHHFNGIDYDWRQTIKDQQDLKRKPD